MSAMKSNAEIAAILVECLNFIGGASGPAEDLDEVFVLKAWDLDSEDGLEIACDLSTKLGIDIPHNENPLVEDDPVSGKRRGRRFREVVAYLSRLVGAQGE